mgnify:CR=1 FL=1
MIRKLAPYTKGYRVYILLGILCSAGEAVLELMLPKAMSNIVDYGIGGNGGAGDRSYILTMGLKMVLMALICLALGVGAAALAAKAGMGFGANVRDAEYRQVQRFSFSNIEHFSTASLITRLTNDVSSVQMTLMMGMRMLVRAPVMLITALVMALRISLQLSQIFLVILPLLALMVFIILRYVGPFFTSLQKATDGLNLVVQEDLNAIRVVKSFVREDHEVEKFGKVSQEIYMDFSKAERILAFNMPLMQICVYACMISVSWIGANLIVGGSMTTGQLTSMFSYIMMMLMSLMMLSMVLTMIIMARASAERITEILNEESDLKNNDHPIEEVKDGSVVFENVSFSYAKDPNKECLKNVNLTVKSGETVGILGGTGTSKTTLVQLIPRLYDATEGRVLVGGVDVRDYDMDALRDQVAMVLQKNVLFSGTIKENLRWGKKDATDEEMVRMCKLAQADPFIQEFPGKYDTYIEQGGSNVSGGQKQRLCIARALLKHPKILILDDSTSAVDTKTDALIRKAFAKEIPDTTKFIIAQRVSSIEDADKILVMDGGAIVAMGTHEELLKTCDIYRETYESQVKGGSDDEQ